MYQGLDSNITKEIVRLCFVQRMNAGWDPIYTETAIQKALHRLKLNLAESNSVKQNLPYYWFKGGPFSEIVAATLEEMTDDKIIKPIQKPNYTLLVLDKKYFNKKIHPHNSDLTRANSELEKIITKLNPYSLDEEIQHQYTTEAPSIFYPRFKLEFIPNLKLYYNIVKTKLSNESNSTNSFQRECLSKLLNLSSSSLPFESIFSKFKNTYFDFDISLTRLLKSHIKETERNYLSLIEDSYKLSLKIWDVFAYGARIMKHDSFYDNKIPSWTKLFDKQSMLLKSKIDEFYVSVLQLVGSKNEQLATKDELSKLITVEKNRKEINFINFFTPIPTTKFTDFDETRFRTIPEFSTFVREGQLEWVITKDLSDNTIKDVIDKCASEKVSIAFSSPATGTEIISYRIIPKRISAAIPIANP